MKAKQSREEIISKSINLFILLDTVEYKDFEWDTRTDSSSTHRCNQLRKIPVLQVITDALRDRHYARDPPLKGLKSRY